MVIKQKWVSMLFYSNRKAHPFSISDVPIYKSIFHLLQAPPVTVYKPLFFNVSTTILMTAHILRAFSGFPNFWFFQKWLTTPFLHQLRENYEPCRGNFRLPDGSLLTWGQAWNYAYTATAATEWTQFMRSMASIYL